MAKRANKKRGLTRPRQQKVKVVQLDEAPDDIHEPDDEKVPLYPVEGDDGSLDQLVR